MRLLITVLLVWVVACVATAGGRVRVASMKVVTDVRDAERAGFAVGTEQPPYYVLYSQTGLYCLVTQREWTRAMVGELSTCNWRYPRP